MIRTEHFRQYEQMLVRLHDMISRGLGEGLEAMRLREDMEGPESSLSLDDVRLLNDLSGDLYMLSDDELPPPTAQPLAPDELRESVFLAYDSQDWNELLRLLRNRPASFDPAHLAYMRANAYGGLGLLHAARAFFDEAARRDPENVNFPCLAMEAALEAGEIEEARRRAVEFLNDPQAPGRHVVTAANVLSQSLSASGGISGAERDLIVRRLKGVLPEEPSSVIRFIGFGTLGFLLRQQGELDEAREAVASALNAAPPGEMFRVARDFLERELRAWDAAGSSGAHGSVRTFWPARLRARSLEVAA